MTHPSLWPIGYPELAASVSSRRAQVVDFRRDDPTGQGQLAVPLAHMGLIMSLKRFLATFACGLAIAGPAAAGIAYSYDVGSFGFTSASPDLYPQLIPAANLVRCDFGTGITCISISIYDNYYSVSATDTAAANPNQVVRIIDVAGCPPYFAVGQVVPTSSCSIFCQR